MSGDLKDIASVVSASHELLDDIRGGAIGRMKSEHEQALVQFGEDNQAALELFNTEKGDALSQFNSEKEVAFSQADSELAGRRAAVDAVLGDLVGQTYVLTNFLDGQLITKSSLNIVEDPQDETKSQWVKVPVMDGGVGRVSYAVANKVTVAHVKRAYSVPGGYPDYTQDRSVTRMQFIVANDAATSEQINAEIARLDLSMYSMGKWDHAARCYSLHTIDIDGLHDYKSVWVRFVNEPYFEGEQAQNVVQFGGNASFAIDRVENFAKVSK